MKPKKVYIKQHEDVGGAGAWIYRGYATAWESLGYEVIHYNSLKEISGSDKKDEQL